LSQNGASVNSAEAQDALGGPSLSAGLMCSEASARGYDLTPDLIWMTGACGQIVPGERGKYEACFGALGSVHLEIT
jgi:2-keto-4-pentenoate hydratase